MPEKKHVRGVGENTASTSTSRRRPRRKAAIAGARGRSLRAPC